MPDQTTKVVPIGIPDGAKVEFRAAGTTDPFVDVGAMSGNISFVPAFDTDEFQTANKGSTDPRDFNHSGALTFTLLDLDPGIYADMSGGIIQKNVISGTPITDSPDQVIAAGWSADQAYEISPRVLATNLRIRAASKPTFTATGSTSGLLAENNDYVVIQDGSTTSGFSIVFSTAGTATVDPAETITIDFTSTTPVERTTITSGRSSGTTSAVEFRITHTDDEGDVRQLEVYRAFFNSGSLDLSFLGQESTGRNTFPMAFTARPDTTRASNQQMYSYSVDNGAGTPH